MEERVYQASMQKADFKAFYDKHFDRVYRFVYFRVRNNVEVAEDLTSEIFIKALANFAKYDPEKSESAWILTIARNHVINHYRDQKESVDIDDMEFSLVGSDARKDEVVKDDERRLRDALDQLEKKDREIIELKHLMGYRFKEIGSLLGKSPGSCRIDAHRAMKKLKEILNETYDVPAKTTQDIA